MPILGLDFGAKRIGVAIVPDDTNFALPLTTIEGDEEQQWRGLEELFKKHAPRFWVVGLPYTMNGAEGEQAAATRDFTKKLFERFNVQVHLVDERMTSRAAAAAGAADIDASSAAFILDSYLAQSTPEDILDI